MKKLIVLFTALAIVSCSNEEIGGLGTKTNLNSIKITDYSKNNEILGSQEMFFENEKLKTIKSSDNRVSDYTYNNQNLVSKIIDYNPDGEILITTTFLYTNTGKITEITRISGPANEEILNNKFVFTHLAGKILLAKSSGNNTAEHSEISLNSNNQFEKQTSFSGAFYYKYDFVNGNLEKCAQFENNGNLTGNVRTYKYTNLPNIYNYKKLLFGNEWKLNNFLCSFYASNSTVFLDLSENLVSEDVVTFFDASSNYTVNFRTKTDYIFDSSNRMSKMTENSSIESGTTSITIRPSIKTEFVFTYKD
ncbi:hypothetical protein RB619_02595 [Flavobacterium sp. LHD-80]|uniref:hypothetical protein n=1 Tax=Flavobacterium sp. LHD-80 TaxID=3071411 RepID=UPI0027E186F6|nr:hypothetical protein [Flavobacterium sp. LHD-80]MDQ6469517.1 hypothetical protein [Flavobacterium sp. LHD-80]